MGRKKKTVKPLDTIWEVSNELWAEIEPILLEERRRHRPRRADGSGPTGDRRSTGSSTA